MKGKNWPAFSVMLPTFSGNFVYRGCILDDVGPLRPEHYYIEQVWLWPGHRHMWSRSMPATVFISARRQPKSDRCHLLFYLKELSQRE